MAADSPSQNLDRIMVRLPDGMRARLTEAAKKAGRSVNAEVVARLEKSLEEDGEFKLMQQFIADHQERLDQIEKRLKQMARNVDILAEREGLID